MTTRDVERLNRARIPHADEYYDRLQYEHDPYAGYRLRPNQHLPHITINADGFRGRPWRGDETTLLFGDSVTFGVGASGDDACFARFLERRLGTPVADASVRAYRIGQHFSRLPALCERLPHLQRVVLWGGYLDLLFWVITGGRLDGAFQFAEKHGPTQGWGAVVARWHHRLRLTAPYQVLRGVVRARHPAVREPALSIEALADHVVAYVQAMHGLCVARKVGFSFLLQPFVHARPQAPDLQRLTDAHDAQAQRKCGRSWYESAARYVGALQALLKRDGTIHWTDCQAWIAEEDLLDQVHLREQAVSRLATQVAPRLGPWVKASAMEVLA
ncbi:MAG: hypothetical protein HY597_00965 [Candidatus Omnitrophica bacterium]|nr:hypothetical protein [Candidatus Omnitrophota bacterium]